MGERMAEKLMPGRLVGAQDLRPQRTRAWAGLGVVPAQILRELRAHRTLGVSCSQRDGQEESRPQRRERG